MKKGKQEANLKLTVLQWLINNTLKFYNIFSYYITQPEQLD